MDARAARRERSISGPQFTSQKEVQIFLFQNTNLFINLFILVVVVVTATATVRERLD
jgi:hypothetical protein